MAILFGIEQIKPVLGNATEAQIMKWRIEFESFPIRKMGNRLVSESGALTAWWRLFLFDRLHLLDDDSKLLATINDFLSLDEREVYNLSPESFDEDSIPLDLKNGGPGNNARPEKPTGKPAAKKKPAGKKRGPYKKRAPK